MSTPTDFGNQILNFDYKQPLEAKEFNQLNYKIHPAGIHEGMLLGLTGNNSSVDVAPGSIYILNKVGSSPELGVNIRTTITDTVTAVSASASYIVCEFEWQDLDNWYMDVVAKGYNDILPNDIILGKADYEGATLVGFDYTRRQNVNQQEFYNRKNENLQVVSDTPTPSNEVIVQSGAAYVNGKHLFIADTNIALPTVTDGMISLVTLDADGNVALINSADQVTPVFPGFPSDKLVLAIITRGPGSIINGTDIDNLEVDKVFSPNINNINTPVTFQEDVTMNQTLFFGGSPGFNRGATIVVASSDSLASSQNGADYIINVASDAGAVITTILTVIASTGGNVIFMEGTYNFDTIVLLTSNIKFIGCRGTIFKRRSSSINKLFDGSSVSNIFFDNFVFDGDSISNTSFQTFTFNSVSYISFKNNEFKNLAGAGTPFVSVAGMKLTTADNVTIQNNYFHNFSGTGGADTSGVLAEGLSNSSISNNLFQSLSGDAVSAISATISSNFNMYTNNHILTLSGVAPLQEAFGISVGGNRNTITENNISNITGASGRNGIFVSGDYNIINTNTTLNSVAAEIKIASGSLNLVTNNITNLLATGPLISDSGTNTLLANNI